MTERIGDWMQTYTGKRFYPADPRPEDIDIEDIAHALSMTCRFTGHIKKFYSTAEHCVWGARIAAPENALEALLHDSSEAYINDIARPAKLSLPDYKRMEQGIERAVAERFNLPFPMSPEVKMIDNIMLVTEASQLFPDGVEKWWLYDEYPEPFPVVLTCMRPETAKRAFLELFYILTANNA